MKLGEQYKGGLSGDGERVTDTAGAGSENFGKDGRKENGGWEKGAKGLSAGSQKGLADVWNVSKAGKKILRKEKALQVERNLADEQGMSNQISPKLATSRYS